MLRYGGAYTLVTQGAAAGGSGVQAGLLPDIAGNVQKNVRPNLCLGQVTV